MRVMHLEWKSIDGDLSYECLLVRQLENVPASLNTVADV